MSNRAVNQFLLIAFIACFAIDALAQVTDYGVSSAPLTERKDDVRTISQAEQAVTSYSDVTDAVGAVPVYSRESAFRSFAPSPLQRKENYVMTIELARFSWSPIAGHSDDKFGGRIAVGFNRPSYNIKNELRLMGNFDIKLDGLIIGLNNTARASFKYDLFRTKAVKETKFDLVLENVVFKIGIPFGGHKKSP